MLPHSPRWWRVSIRIFFCSSHPVLRCSAMAAERKRQMLGVATTYLSARFSMVFFLEVSASALRGPAGICVCVDVSHRSTWQMSRSTRTFCGAEGHHPQRGGLHDMTSTCTYGRSEPSGAGTGPKGEEIWPRHQIVQIGLDRHLPLSTTQHGMWCPRERDWGKRRN